jgi:hypothetical protein
VRLVLEKCLADHSFLFSRKLAQRHPNAAIAPGVIDDAVWLLCRDRVRRAALRAAGCEIVREEKVSGTSRDGRPELDTLLAFLRAGRYAGGHSDRSSCPIPT